MWPNPQETEDLVTFTEEILNGKLHFLRSVSFDEDRRYKTIIVHRLPISAYHHIVDFLDLLKKSLMENFILCAL